MGMDIQASATAFPFILDTATMEARFTGEDITDRTGKKQVRSNSLFPSMSNQSSAN